jgi:hypothetical protein
MYQWGQFLTLHYYYTASRWVQVFLVLIAPIIIIIWQVSSLDLCTPHWVCHYYDCDPPRSGYKTPNQVACSDTVHCTIHLGCIFPPILIIYIYMNCILVSYSPHTTVTMWVSKAKHVLEFHWSDARFLHTLYVDTIRLAYCRSNTFVAIYLTFYKNILFNFNKL